MSKEIEDRIERDEPVKIENRSDIIAMMWDLLNNADDIAFLSVSNETIDGAEQVSFITIARAGHVPLDEGDEG